MAHYKKQLYVDSLAFSYATHKPLLTGVYLECSPGEIVGLLGRNGSGKSTLMKSIFGTLTPHYAIIRVNEKTYSKAYLSKKVCYLPQHKFIPTYLTVADIVKLMIKVKNKQDQIIQENKIIGKIINQKIAELSGGEIRYLELMLLLQQDADFYLLDEPFSGVSPYMKESIQQLILDNNHKGFIISDHDYQTVLETASRIVLLQNGGCRKINNKKELELFYVPEGTFDNYD